MIRDLSPLDFLTAASNTFNQGVLAIGHVILKRDSVTQMIGQTIFSKELNLLSRIAHGNSRSPISYLGGLDFDKFIAIPKLSH